MSQKVLGSIPASAARDMYMTEISLKRRKPLKRFTKKKQKKTKKKKLNWQEWPKGYGFDSH